jgi:hypothetical protein
MTPFDGTIEAGIWALLAVVAFWAGARVAGQATGVSGDLSPAPIATAPDRNAARRR